MLKGNHYTKGQNKFGIISGIKLVQKLKLHKIKDCVSDPIILIENNFQEDLDKIQATFTFLLTVNIQKFPRTMSFLAKI